VSKTVLSVPVDYIPNALQLTMLNFVHALKDIFQKMKKVAGIR